MKTNLKDSHVKESIRFIRSKVRLRPKIALIFGSGLGDLAEALTSRHTIESSMIPHYPAATVQGHRGKLVWGKMKGIPLLAFQGRTHFYETGDLEHVLYPIHLAHAMGIKTLIVTNAAGAVNREFAPGDLMLITDHINLTFENPLLILRRKKSEVDIYDKKLLNRIRKVAQRRDIPLREGVYCGLKGPSYETAAEIQMVHILGGDAVGMSTVNEASLAAALGMRVAGISCITNLATGIKDEKLSHVEVTEVANKVKHTFVALLAGVIEKIR